MKTLLKTLFILSDDAYLSLQQDNVRVETDKGTTDIPLRSLETILSFSYKGASPILLGRCADMGVSVAFFSPHGRYLCSILGENNRNVLLRKEQYRSSDHPSQALKVSSSSIFGKIYNERWVLERALRDHPLSVDKEKLKTTSLHLKDAATNALAASTPDELRGIEGDAAHDYFDCFDDLILTAKSDFYFHQRNRRPPRDRMNALLSFAYTVLMHDCMSALQGVGLDPYVGFLHVDRPGRPSLALDLMEEFRSVASDRFVLSLVNNREIKPSDFDIAENGSVMLNDQGRKVFLQQWWKRKLRPLQHPYLQENMPWGLVPYVQALLLSRTIRGDLEKYPPFLWK